MGPSCRKLWRQEGLQKESIEKRWREEVFQWENTGGRRKLEERVRIAGPGS